MSTTTRRYQGVHKHQLFHWIAASSHRAAGLHTPLTAAMRSEYLDCLRGSLTNGLWVKTPRHPEELRLGAFHLPLTLGIACFTEWSLGQSLAHTSEYGRMAFGFSKAWLIKRGGQPVTYFDHSPRSGFFHSLVALLKATTANPKDYAAAFHLAHFAKRIHPPASPPAARPKTAPVVPRTARPKTRAAPVPAKAAAKPKAPDPFARFWSKTMPYLEEREWRVVEHPRLVKSGALVPNSAAPARPPAYFLPYRPGEELFTLVLPDNRTVSEVLQTTWFTDRLFPKSAPHVTVLSLQDIGTF